MGKIGRDIAEKVGIESDWWSKINWTQVVGVAASILTVASGGKLDLSAETQVQIVVTIQSIAGIVTIWLRRNSTTITPTAAAKLGQRPDG
jgi:hypothetical protein